MGTDRFTISRIHREPWASSPRERFIMPTQLLDHGFSQILSSGQLPVGRCILTGRREATPTLCPPLSCFIPLISSLIGPHLGSCRTRLLPDPDQKAVRTFSGPRDPKPDDQLFLSPSFSSRNLPQAILRASAAAG